MTNYCECGNTVKTETVKQEFQREVKEESASTSSQIPCDNFPQQGYEHKAKKIKTEIDETDEKPEVDVKHGTCTTCGQLLDKYCHVQDVKIGAITTTNLNKEHQDSDSNYSDHEGEVQLAETSDTTDNVTLLTCSNCTFKTPSSQILKLHQEVHHGRKNGYYRCTKCQFKSSHTKGFNQHISVHINYKHFKCRFCTASYKTARSLNVHLKKKHPESLLKCDSCDFKTCSSPALKQHIKQYHHVNKSHSGIFSCPLFENCSFSANSVRSIELHEVVHNTEKGERYCCSECDYSTVRIDSFNNHILDHTDERPSKCHHCTSSFKGSKYLYQHLKHKHAQTTIHCQECEFSSFFEHGMKEHKQKFHSPKVSHSICCQLCNFEAQSERSIDLHQVIHNYSYTKKGEHYSCPICEYWSEYKQHFNQHILIHTKERAHSCPHCIYRATLSSALLGHLRAMHPDTKIQCESCDFSTFLPSAMEKHTKKGHPEVKVSCQLCKFQSAFPLAVQLHRIVHETKTGDPYCCTECQFKSQKIYYFNEHINTHTNEKPFSCPHCSHKCNYAVTLKKHIKKMHPDLLLNCEYCDFTCDMPCAMKKHMELIHIIPTSVSELITCEYCDFIATSTESIQLHQIVHTTNKGNKYSCPRCTYKADAPSNFNRHIPVHTGDKPHRCRHCAMCFKGTNMLNMHMKLSHLDKV